MKKASIECQGVSLADEGIQVLRNATMEVEPGEFFALLGPAGSGKSTLLRVIAGFIQADRGHVAMDGRRVDGISAPQRHMAMVFNAYGLWSRMTVWHTVAFGLVERRVRRTEIKAKVAAMLELFGLTPVARQYPQDLPAVQQQRVALARALILEPQVLLLDDPIDEPDKHARVPLLQDLLKWQRHFGITAIYATRNADDAMSTSDRMAIIDEGKIVQTGTPTTIFDHPCNRRVAAMTGGISALEGEVMHRSDSHITLGFGELGEIRLPADANAPDSTRLAASFRPHTVQMEPGNTRDSRFHWLPGLIERSEFMGAYTCYHVRIGDQLISAHQAHYAGNGIYPTGATVSVGLEPAQIRLLEI
ncbi:MAG TPA: ABC transporter ATP-binding protein [Candidimonas sp.]|nr:ABC transporter ATP-binding protein [Candidimonas sp.]